jgi:uncharacterized protein (DUF362 family)
MKRPTCAVTKNRDIKKAVYDALSQIEIPDLSGKNVLLKPNIGRNVGKNLGINTSPSVALAVFQYLKKKFDAKYYIGDSPIIGVNCKEAFISSGYGFFLCRKDIQFIDLDRIKPKILPIKDGKILKQIKVTGFIHDFDYIISIPVLKMHMHTGATLSFKNMKGLLFGREKIKLHQLHVPKKIKQGYKELDIAIADLARVMEPDLVVIDAFYAMEGMGPSAGDRKRLDTIIASKVFLAADIVALSIVGLDIEHAPHLKLIAKQKSGVSTINEIRTIPKDITPFRKEFAVPPIEVTIKNKKVNLIDEGSCSACQSSVFLFLKNNEPLIDDYFFENKQFNIAIGNDVKNVPNGTILIGNCTACHKKNGIFFKGCPPSQTIIKEVLEASLKRK